MERTLASAEQVGHRAAVSLPRVVLQVLPPHHQWVAGMQTVVASLSDNLTEALIALAREQQGLGASDERDASSRMRQRGTGQE